MIFNRLCTFFDVFHSKKLHIHNKRYRVDKRNMHHECHNLRVLL